MVTIRPDLFSARSELAGDKLRDGLDLKKTRDTLIGFHLSPDDDGAIKPAFGGRVKSGRVDAAEIGEISAIDAAKIESSQIEIDGADAATQLDYLIA
jgi:hypothetical protein